MAVHLPISSRRSPLHRKWSAWWTPRATGNGSTSTCVDGLYARKKMSDHNLNAYNIFDLREMALKRTPKFLFEYVDRGTEDEISLRTNRVAFERIKLKP